MYTLVTGGVEIANFDAWPLLWHVLRKEGHVHKTRSEAE